MKIRESGMPSEAWWASFFDVEILLDRLDIRNLKGDIVDLGCGYGTFTVAAAVRTAGTIYAFDIESAMVQTTAAKVRERSLENVVVRERDFLTEGTGLPAASCVYVMAFNILHAAEPQRILEEAWRILRPEGRIGIVHWIVDPSTPRGPTLALRPEPEQCRTWLRASGFTVHCPRIQLPPFHYGVVGVK